MRLRSTIGVGDATCVLRIRRKKSFPAALFAAALALQAAPLLADVGTWSPADEKTDATVVSENYCNIKIRRRTTTSLTATTRIR
jgi:hypothetical protein